VKRRNLATAGAFLAALLVAALAAASVSAATSSHKAASVSGKGWQLQAGHTKHGQNLAPKLIGTGQFKPTAPHQPKFINSPTPSNANAILQHDRLVPGKLGPDGKLSSKAGASAGAAPSAAFTPHAHSLPITSNKYDASAKGLNAYSQDAFGAGYIDTPPDQALAEGNGYVFEAVNNVFMITDTNFGHVTNAEPMEQFWAPAILPRATARSPTRRLTTTTRRGSGT